MTNRLVAIGTKKGLFMARRNGSDRWELDGPHLLMNVVGAIGIDTRAGRPRVLAGTDHGHWGPSMSYSDDLGASWQETDHAPISFPTETGVSLVKLWQIQAAGADRPGVVYAGTEPAALFCSEDGGLTYELVNGLWHHPDRTRLIEWIPEAGMLYLHTIVVDPRDSDTSALALSSSGPSARAPAICTASNTPESTLVFKRQYAAIASALPRIAAHRQPDILQHFDSENTSTPTSMAPGVARNDGAT
jgi:hypothetical protein